MLFISFSPSSHLFTCIVMQGVGRIFSSLKTFSSVAPLPSISQLSVVSMGLTVGGVKVLFDGIKPSEDDQSIFQAIDVSVSPILKSSLHYLMVFFLWNAVCLLYCITCLLEDVWSQFSSSCWKILYERCSQGYSTWCLFSPQYANLLVSLQPGCLVLKV